MTSARPAAKRLLPVTHSVGIANAVMTNAHERADMASPYVVEEMTKLTPDLIRRHKNDPLMLRRAG